MISFGGKGDFSKTRTFLHNLKHRNHFRGLDKYGKEGVEALSRATPVESDLTAKSWEYRIIEDERRVRIEWYNTNIDTNGTPIAILIQYGHGTRSGSFVQGRDYINPAMRPVFDRIADDIWKKVKSS